MSDSTIWVAAVTGGTALLASWVTTHGNARTAKVQADASARAQQRNHVREMRRAAYLELIEHGHVTSQLYWKVGDAYVQLPEHKARLARIEELRVDLRAAFDPLMRSCRIVVLEGPSPVAEAAEAVKEAAGKANKALWDVSRGEKDARKKFDAAEKVFLDCLAQFTSAAQTAMADS